MLGGTSLSDAIWRRERDSNPRYPFGYNGFQDRRHQPLGHPSKPGAVHYRITGRCASRARAARVIVPPPPNRGRRSRRRAAWGRRWTGRSQNESVTSDGPRLGKPGTEVDQAPARGTEVEKEEGPRPTRTPTDHVARRFSILGTEVDGRTGLGTEVSRGRTKRVGNSLTRRDFRHGGRRSTRHPREGRRSLEARRPGTARGTEVDRGRERARL